MITYEDLKKYRQYQIVIKLLEEEIQEAYYPVKSPNAKKIEEGKKSVRDASNPTAMALDKIEKLNAKLERYRGLIQELDAFIDNIEDQYIASICNLHYRKGLSWRQTSYKIYGYIDQSDTVRKAVRRYFKKKER